MVKNIKVCILDSEYTVIMGKREELPVESEYDGLCYTYDKMIYIVEDNENVKTSTGNSCSISEVIYHEVTHAFIFESGYTPNSDEESLVLWMSRYVWRINKCVLEILGKFDKTKRI